jgi:hypothetical protein
MLYFICLAPFLLAVIYSFYLLIKRKDMHDEFFHLSRKTKKETMLERIRLLEKINQADYRSDMIEIEKFYSDGRITEAEADKMEKIITNTYFNNFQSKWIAFKRAEFPMKALFILSLLYGFVYVNLVFIEGYNGFETDLSLELILIIVNVSLILPYLFSLTLLGFLATFISMLNLSFSEYGGINRATITSEELVKALKPGGRKTKIVLGSAWSRTFFRI